MTYEIGRELMVVNMQANGTSNGEPEEFMEVWERNLDEAFAQIRQLVLKYPYVAMVSDMMVGGE